jgi:MoxR-like ATPase
VLPPRENPGQFGPGPEAVLLLDEIDKADPDVPNDLLVPLGSGRFEVKETGTRVERTRGFFLVITTNGERDLTPAFVRRCVRLKLDHPDVQRLVQIAGRHFQGQNEALYQPLAEWVVKSRQAASQRGVRQPSTAEFLDAIQACAQLRIGLDSPEWQALSQLILSKADPSGGGA